MYLFSRIGDGVRLRLSRKELVGASGIASMVTVCTYSGLPENGAGSLESLTFPSSDLE